MKYYIIGSGSKGNASLIYNDTTLLLIDMGLSKKRLEEGLFNCGFSLQDIDACLFTHDHHDHTYGVRFLPSYKCFALDETLNISGYNRISLFSSFNIKDFKITPIKVLHDAYNPCGFIIEDDKEKFVYITDTGYIPDETMKLLKNPDYLLIESNHDVKALLQSDREESLKQRILSEKGHLSNEDSALYALDIIGNNIKEIVLAHLSEECNTPDLALKAYKKVFKRFGIDSNDICIKVASQNFSLKGGK